MITTYDITDIERRGFVIIPNFLNFQEIAEIEKTYQTLLLELEKQSDTNKNYNIFPGKIPNSVVVKADGILTEIRKYTGLLTNLVRPSASFIDNKLIKFGWHQDHEPYYLSQNAYHNLNFWIPIFKPTPDGNGMDVIPLDALAQKAPDLYQNHVLGKGATDWIRDDKNIRIKDNESGKIIPLDFDFNDLKSSPILNPGDLFLLRGDVPHRSQQPTAHRLAISIQPIYTEQIITREKFYSGCENKREMINKAPGNFGRLVRAFDANSSLTLGQALTY
jgi:hypothetical protein